MSRLNNFPRPYLVQDRRKLSTPEEIRVWYNQLYYALSDSENEIITVKEENKRLTAENNFMLRLINERISPE